MARPSRYPQELQRRAVRMVIESRSDYETEAAAIRSVAGKLGITTLTRTCQSRTGLTFDER